MEPQVTEQFELPLDALEQYHQRKIARGHATTANVVTVLLVSSVVLSMVLYTLTAWVFPKAEAQVNGFLETWLKFVSPLVGTAVGFYFGSRQARRP